MKGETILRDCKTCVDYGNCTADDMASCAHGDNIGHSDYRPKTSEYIKREDAIKFLFTDAPEQVGYFREDAIDCIKFMDAADVTSVRHGKWIMPLLMEDGHIHAECSHCHKIRIIDDYCSACGAIMDLEDTED